MAPPRPKTPPPDDRNARADLHERVRELERRERRLRALLDDGPQAVLVHRERVLYANAAAAGLFGYDSPAELCALPASHLLFHPEERPALGERLRLRLAGGAVPERYEARALRRDGSLLCLSVAAHRVEWEHGPAVHCTYTDLSERIRAEQEREESRRLLWAVLDAIPLEVSLKDRAGRFLLANEAMSATFGQPRAALLGRTAEEVGGLLPERLAIGRELERVVLEEGRVAERRNHLVTLPDGSRQYRHLLKVPLRDEAGQVTGVVGISLDVTEQQHAQEALRAQRRLLQAVFDTIPTWLFVKDRESRFLLVNDTFARDVGVPADYFHGLDHWQAPQGTPAEREQILRDEQRIVAEGRTLEAEESLMLPDGRRTVRHVRKVPLRDEDGHITGLVGISEDITERRVLEEQFRRMQRIESLGTLAGGIAHDFNNILFPIIGFTELTLRELPPDSRLHENLSIVHDAALRARDIVSQILTFSRQTENRPAVMALRPLLHEGLRFLRSTLPSPVRIEERLADAPLHVNADAVQLHQVLMNLCVNGAQAMPDGGTLTVTLEAVELRSFGGYTGEPLSGACARLSVRDTGVGMDPVTQSRMFEPFYTTKPVGKGTGLGLAAVLGIVAQHAGTIDVRSAPGEGTQIDLYLPLVPAPSGPVDEAEPQAGVEGASILFVDDEWGIVELVRTVLGEAGYQVAAFASSRAALSAFEREPHAYDLLVTDQSMPGLTGEKLVQAVRHIRPELPVILGTGFSEVLTPERARELGIDCIYHKPITPRHLLELVAAALQARDLAAPPPSR
jgi:PAS domain S-box-containing protein